MIWITHVREIGKKKKKKNKYMNGSYHIGGHGSPQNEGLNHFWKFGVPIGFFVMLLSSSLLFFAIIIMENLCNFYQSGDRVVEPISGILFFLVL